MFILASESPQRKAILERLGIPFDMVPSGFDESLVQEHIPVARAKILAESKASAVLPRYPDRWIIGVDTLVVAENGELLEKPVDARDAERMLQLHSGKTSAIHSALTLRKNGEVHTDVSTAFVRFRELSNDERAWWIGTGLWRNRSGAFQIEGEGEKLILAIEGELETVVGFPVKLFYSLARSINAL